MNPEDTKTDTVDPARLSMGHWDLVANKQIDEGDISQSYSADVIAEHNTFRRPFRWKDGFRISVGGSFTGTKVHCVRTYRIIPVELYDDETHTYTESCTYDENHKSKFTYEGMRVKKGDKEYVLSEELLLVPNEKKIDTTKQLTLF